MTTPDWLEPAVRRCSRESWTLGHAFERFREMERRTDSQLAVDLGCTEEQLQWLSLCRRPAGARFAMQAAQLAKDFEVNLTALVEILHHLEVVDALLRTRADENTDSVPGAPATPGTDKPIPDEQMPREKPLLDHDELQWDTDFLAEFGEDLGTALDLDTWTQGIEIEQAMTRFRYELAQAEAPDVPRPTVEWRPRIRGRPGAPREAGLYRALPEEMESIYRSLLFAGGVEAVHSTFLTQDSPLAGITRIGIAIIGYAGAASAYSQRLISKELEEKHELSLDDVYAWMDSGKKPARSGRTSAYSRLACRAIHAYAERAALVDKSSAEWRMGQGSPCEFDVLTSPGSLRLLDSSLDTMRRLILGHKKFVLIDSSSREDHGLPALSNSLQSGEYVVLESLEHQGQQVLDRWEHDSRSRQRVATFVRECGPSVLTGLFRTSRLAPPRLFHAHREHIHLAARIAMADSLPHPERGIPSLLGAAKEACRDAFGKNGLQALLAETYAQPGMGAQEINERMQFSQESGDLSEHLVEDLVS
ncbi:hypothetical protein [Myxococcus eversor]|uniref:hypothetical protein n=1 Tax=Myxococcus eversor TaxID=2709661 RepID=UPI001966F56F|nr:hypothetical protein [Myxococcus eversor]